MKNQSTNSSSDDVYIISYHTQRQLIGVLGMALPFACWGINAVVNHCDMLNNPFFVNKEFSQAYIHAECLKSSVSHFYYTAAGPLFTGILITVSVFLFTYFGHKRKDEFDVMPWLTDRRLAVTAALCALFIVVFPTGADKNITDNIHIFVASKCTGKLHYLFAFIFFAAISLFCIVNFRRRNDVKKLSRNAAGMLYMVCGIIMLICLAILFVVMIFELEQTLSLPYWFVFAMETIMLFFFGIAWLVKGTETVKNSLKKINPDSPPATNR